MRLNDVNWNQVHYFYEVAKRLSMKKAAVALGVSVPTVSEQIKRLEASLTVQLFERGPRQLALTPDGDKLFRCAADMFSAGFRFLDAVSHDPIGGYTARIGIQETILMVASQIVADYWDRFTPFGSITTFRELYFERIIERIMKNELDWAIVLAPPKTPRVEAREIGAFEVAFCCAETVFRRFKRPEDILRVLPLARNSWDTALNGVIDERLRGAGITVKELLESDHREVCLALTHRGRCVSTLSTAMLDRQQFGAGLRTFRVGPPIEQKMYAVWSHASRKMIAIRKLAEMLDGPPASPRDPELQLRVADVPPDWLVDD